MNSPDDWATLCRLLCEYGVTKYGHPPTSFSLGFAVDLPHLEPLPPLLPAAPTNPATREAAARRDPWGSGPDPKHLSDFQKVYWPGLGTFRLSESQARVVEMLWDARFGSDCSCVPQADLIAAAGSVQTRLLDIFRSNGKVHPAWGTLIVKDGVGLYRLPALDGEDAGPAE